MRDQYINPFDCSHKSVVNVSSTIKCNKYTVHLTIFRISSPLASIAILAKCIAIRIAGKVSRYIDASMNRAKTNIYQRNTHAYGSAQGVCSIRMGTNELLFDPH